MRPLRLSLALTALLAPVLLFYGEALTAGPGGAPPLGSEALSLLVTTIEVAGGATLLALLLGSAAALALQGVPPGWRPAILALCATPLLVPSAILTGAWLGMCAPAAPRGWAASACMALGGSARDPATFLYTPAGAAILGGLISWPWVTFAIRAAFAGIDPGAVESARLHGGRGRIWCAVLTPRLLPALGLGGLLAFTWTAADLGVPGLLAVRTSSALVEEAFGGWGDLRAGALCSLLPVTFSLVLALGVARSGVIRPGSFSDPRPSPGGEAALRAALPAPLLLLCLGLAATGWLVSVGLPCASLAEDAWPQLRHHLWDVPLHRRALGNTLLFGVAAAVLCPACALLLAGLHGRPGRTAGRGMPTTVVLAFLFMIPATLVGMGILRLTANPVGDLLASGPWTVIWADLLRFAFLSWAILWPAWQGVDPTPGEAARLAALPLLTRWRVILAPPLMRPLGLAAVLAGCAAAGELGATSLLRAPGYDSAVLVCYRFLHYRYDDALASLSLAVMAMTLAVVPATAILAGRRGSSR